ncbi:MAG: element excision factor XisH family protein [Cyanobacteria bacterium P01_E01_bin.42]
MAAKDIFHKTVCTALEKEGWIITHDPLFVKASQKFKAYIDLGAEKLLTAEKDRQKIAVEIKSFLGMSSINEFHLAVGQFLNYRLALQQLEPERILYLAISLDIYEELFLDLFIQQVIESYQIKLLVFYPNKKEVVLWKN